MVEFCQEQEVATPFGAMAALKETTEEGVAPQPEQLGTKVPGIPC